MPIALLSAACLKALAQALLELLGLNLHGLVVHRGTVRGQLDRLHRLRASADVSLQLCIGLIHGPHIGPVHVLNVRKLSTEDAH